MNVELYSHSSVRKNLQKSSPSEGKIHHIIGGKINKNTSLVAVKVVRQPFLVLPHLTGTDFSVRDIYPAGRDEGSKREFNYPSCVGGKWRTPVFSISTWSTKVGDLPP